MDNKVVFSVSSVLTLMFAQAIALERKAQGAECKLVLWSFKDDPHILESFRKVLVPGLWSLIVELPSILNKQYSAKNLPLRRDGVVGDFASIRKGEVILNEKWELIGEASELFICSSNAIDLGLYTHCPSRPQLCYLEDGLQAYFSSHYTSLGARGRAVGAKRYVSKLLSWLRRSALTCSGIEPLPLTAKGLFPEEYPYAEIYSIFPEHVKAAPASAHCVSLMQFMSPGVIRMLEDGIPSFRFSEATISNLYLSRPDSEDRICSFEYEVSNTVRFISQIHEETNEVVWLKPHPRDSRRKIEEILRRSPYVKLLELNSPYPIELIAQRLGVVRVYSIWTASLVYLKLLFYTETYSFLPSLISPGEKEDTSYSRIFDEIYPIFRELITWIDLNANRNS